MACGVDALRIACWRSPRLSVATLYFYGKPDLAPILTGYLGLLLQGGSLLAIGTFISTTTKNQIIAAFATFASACCSGCSTGSAAYRNGGLGEGRRVPVRDHAFRDHSRKA